MHLDTYTSTMLYLEKVRANLTNGCLKSYVCVYFYKNTTSKGSMSISILSIFIYLLFNEKQLKK